jgi:hypothetical protein
MPDSGEFGPRPSAISWLRAASVPLLTILQPIKLDPPAVADDPNYLPSPAAQPNLPEANRAGLAKLY